MTSGGDKLKIGISSCLLGHEVRYDGGHKLQERLRSLEDVEWVPVCPELEVGMGVPREPVDLHDKHEGVRMIGASSGTDWTDRMQAWVDGRLTALSDLDGYVLKAGSPSCGPRGVPLRRPDRGVDGEGPGLFAARLSEAFPDMPVATEEDVATDPDGFLDRARAHRLSRSSG